MTGVQWKRSKDPSAMLECLVPARVRTRSLALFAIAACRQDEIIMGGYSSRLAVEWSEKLLEGMTTYEDDDGPSDGDCYLMAGAANRCMTVTGCHLRGDTEQAWESTLEVVEFFVDVAEERAQIARLLRDIFGNPFRAVAFDPRWRTEHAVGLALRMYDDRDFRAMPILADALEEAGCENADILAHCREPGTHVRGCWLVDLVLGKA